MLSIQPSITNQTIRKAPVFKGDTSSNTIDEHLYESKRDYYEGQKNEFESILNDERTVKPLKDIARVFKVISEILFEGWAVAWGASKGAKFVKSSVVGGINSNVGKGIKNVLKPLGKGIVAAGEKIAQYAQATVKYVKATPTYAKFQKNAAEIIEKMDNNKYGKIALKALNTIYNGVEEVAGWVVKPFKKFAASLKNTSFDAAYDKAAKATSTTLGVGAGATCGYNEVMHPERANVNEQEETEKVAEDRNDVDLDDETPEALDEEVE